MIVRAVGDDLGVLVGQNLRSEFLDAFGWDVQRTGDVRLAIAVGRERLDHRDLLLVKFGFQVFRRNCAVHFNLPADDVFDAEEGRFFAQPQVTALQGSISPNEKPASTMP